MRLSVRSAGRVLLAVLIAAGVLIAGLSVAGATPLGAVGASSVPAVYADQELDWSACFPPEFELPLECASMRVPLDWAHPNGPDTLEVAVSRVPSTGEPRGVLFTNPGGPGYPGSFLLPLFFHFAKPDVVAAYDVIGLDPRGSGESTPVHCETLSDVELPADVRNRSPENRAQLRSFAQAYLDRCLEPAGDLVRYTNTFQTIRDLDLLRALLGEERISYYGYSAGTWLGAWYAGQFPGRVDRFVFDGNIDFTSSWYDLTASWPRAVQRKFETDFLPWIAQHDETYGYGSSAGEAMVTWEARRAALVAQPLVVSPGCTIRATDFDQTTWKTLGFDGVGGPGFLELGQGLSILERFDEATPEELQFVNDFFECLEKPASFEGMGPAEVGTGCGDTPSPDYDTYAKDSEQLGRRYPLLGWLAETLGGHCAFWPFPVTEKPRLDGKGLPPILMVNNDRDPLTPIEGARHAAAKFKAARLLVVENESHHTIYGLGNECADGYVDRYLLDGVLPTKGATCEGLSLPDPTAASSRVAGGGAGRSELTRDRLRSRIESIASAIGEPAERAGEGAATPPRLVRRATGS